MKTYIFTICLIGSGNDEDDAWDNAVEGFTLDPGVTPESDSIEEVEEDEQ